MPTRTFRGIFTIPQTPFDEAGALDERSLRRCIEFCVEAGAHGVVAPIIASEYTSLSDDERETVFKAMVEVVGGAVPVVAGVTGGSPQHTAALARRAEAAGCDAVIAMLPNVMQVSPDESVESFATLSEAVSVPVFIQNHDRPWGTLMSPELVARVIREVPKAAYVKEESLPPPEKTAAILKLAGKGCKGVMGGWGGLYIPEEHKAGGCGNMPACQITDALVNVWNALDAGKASEARVMFNRLLPLMRLEGLYGFPYWKYVLYRRGVIASPALRIPFRGTLSADAIAELETAMREADDLMTCRKYRFK